MRGFHQKVSTIVEKTVKQKWKIVPQPPCWEVPSREAFGDLSSMVALKIASKVKKSPLEIAELLKGKLEKALGKEIDKIEVLKPGFINLFLAKDTLIASLNELLKNKEGFFRQKQSKKILLEFVSANPTGPLSIAHGRQAVVGDVIGNILQFFGNSVVREYYVNDEGRQIQLLIESVKARSRELAGEAVYFPQNGYHGEYVKDIARAFLRQKPSDITLFTRQHILNRIQDDLRKLAVRFDSWVSQRKMIEEAKVDEAIRMLKKKKVIYEEEGAVWFSSTIFGDDKNRVVKKADGEFTYFASDIAYHLDKINRKAEILINLWGPDHHGYIERVKAAIKALGFNSDILKIIIIQLVSIKTKERMSRRKGTAILLSDLIDEVGRDVARFYYPTRRSSSHLEFDIDLAQEASFNNPYYYIQYVCARIESIFRKAEFKGHSPRYSRYLNNPQELALLRLLMQFFYVLEKAYYSLEPVFIIEYLKRVAAVFHKFYESQRVIGEKKEVMYARLNLLEASRIVLHCGLSLLGITPVKQM